MRPGGRYRDEIDWARLVREGGTIPVNGYPGVTALVAPLDSNQDVVVILIPAQRRTVERLKGNLDTYLALVKSLLAISGAAPR